MVGHVSVSDPSSLKIERSEGNGTAYSVFAVKRFTRMDVAFDIAFRHNPEYTERLTVPVFGKVFGKVGHPTILAYPPERLGNSGGLGRCVRSSGRPCAALFVKKVFPMRSQRAKLPAWQARARWRGAGRAHVLRLSSRHQE